MGGGGGGEIISNYMQVINFLSLIYAYSKGNFGVNLSNRFWGRETQAENREQKELVIHKVKLKKIYGKMANKIQ